MKILLITILTLFSSLTFAKQSWQNATADWENSPYLNTVPPFCDHISPKIIKNPKYHTDWKKKFGREMVWSNHFCTGLVKIHICQTYFGSPKKKCLEHMTEGPTYWLNNIHNPNFKLLPYIHFSYGELLNEIGDTGQAIIQYQNSLKKNPKYIKAYKGLINSYIKIGALKEAEATVNTALKIKKTKSLVRQKQKIDKLLSSQ